MAYYMMGGGTPKERKQKNLGHYATALEAAIIYAKYVQSLDAPTHCERNPLCTRGYHHGGKGGRCKLKGGANKRRSTPEPETESEPKQQKLTLSISSEVSDFFR